MKFGLLAGVASSLSLGLSLGAASFTSPAYAQESAKAESAEETAARFGVRASVLDISLSPSGTKIAWIAPGPEHAEVLKIFDLESSDGVQTVISNTEKIGASKAANGSPKPG